MKHVSILVPEAAVLAAVDDPRHVFSMVNSLLEKEGRPPAFEIALVGASREVRLHDGRFTVHVDTLLDEIERTDLIFIPACSGPMDEVLARNHALIPWIIGQRARGAEVVSLCVGAFFLARTGLLDKKKCSTHWRAADEFRRMFPDVDLVTDQIITEEDGIYTSGGATSYWNLLLYLVEKFCGRETAIVASKVFAIDLNRYSQSQFIIFKGQKQHADEPVKRAQKYIEGHFSEKVTIEELSAMFAISRRNFERRFKRATSNTVNEYLQRVRVEAAKKSFETTRKNILEVMMDVGYSDTKSFRGAFKKITGMTPADYRSKYHQR